MKRTLQLLSLISLTAISSVYAQSSLPEKVIKRLIAIDVKSILEDEINLSELETAAKVLCGKEFVEQEYDFNAEQEEDLKSFVKEIAPNASYEEKKDLIIRAAYLSLGIRENAAALEVAYKRMFSV